LYKVDKQLGSDIKEHCVYLSPLSTKYIFSTLSLSSGDWTMSTYA